MPAGAGTEKGVSGILRHYFVVVGLSFFKAPLSKIFGDIEEKKPQKVYHLQYQRPNMTILTLLTEIYSVKEYCNFIFCTLDCFMLCFKGI